jgi:tRNA (adenine22-N1)-methyltransferase
MVLSERLQFMYDQLLLGQPVWDLCCDHGYLGTAAAASGHFPAVHFVDRVPQIIQRLEDRLARQSWAEKCSFKNFDAGELSEPLIGNAVIGGVGGHTLFKILKTLSSRGMLQADRLILCPQRDEEKLEEWFKNPASKLMDFHCASRNLVYDRIRERTVFVFDRRK